MPYKSTAQRAYLHANRPGIAARWDKETPPGAILPRHVGDLKKPKSRLSEVFKRKNKK